MGKRHQFHFSKPLVALAVSILVWLALSPYNEHQRSIGAIFTFTVVLWATEAFPVGVTALLGMALLALFGGVSQDQAFSGLGDPIIPLFIGSLMIAKAMETTGLSKRIALWVMSRPKLTATPGRLLLSVCGITALISLFLSNTATTAIMLPISRSIIDSLGIRSDKQPFAIALLLALTFAASVSVGTPIGTPPDLIAVEQIEQSARIEIGFLEWMSFGIPITVVLLGTVWLVLRILFVRGKLDTSVARKAAEDERSKLGPVTDSERSTLFVLAIALVLWLSPPLLAPLIQGISPGSAAWIQQRLNANVVGVFAALLLFMLPAKSADEKHPLSWKRAAEIDWGIVLLLAGGLSLGNVLFSSGLANSLGDALAKATGASTLWAITGLAIGLSILMSEITSNTAAATAVLPVVIGLAENAHVSPIPPALGAALGASLGFLLPFSTSTNAIVYSSGLIPQKKLILTGAIIDVFGGILVFLCLRILLPLFGLDR